ncbi:creatininase family protein [Carboxylicivirga sediminis]|uniref:Creatininase family protein n=1 Tax=Carboxylicivirga sediminis TaxID=2006564 RepID=A0A941IWS1_9BACT|nr:creatininase family protein [Carboxylicivirga sediminis]MBR8535455.1 creatininase family protein [Carboxylicivirga sediminis]
MQLAQLNLQDIKKHRFDLAILPWGATEAHNFHLPYGTDNYQNGVIINQSAQLANERGAKVLVLPEIPFGVNTGQTDIPYVINMLPSTQQAILKDVATSVFKQCDKLLIFNGHGGNDFKTMIRELGLRFPGKKLVTCNWFQALEADKYFAHAGDHADETETSLMQYLYPELVRPLSEAGNGQNKLFKVNALNQKWAWAEREWTKVSNDTGVGNPSKSTAEKGERFFNDLCQVISQFLIDLSKTSVDDFYGY